MAHPTNTRDTESELEPEIEWGPPTAWLPDPRTGRMREYTHAEVFAALLAGDPEEEQREREEAEWLEREEAARMECEEAQRRERESAEWTAREQEQRSSRKRGHTHAEMLAALLGDSKREKREPKQGPSNGRDNAPRGGRDTAESSTREHGQQPNPPPVTKKTRGRTHADMLAALLGDPEEERRQREQDERRERDQAQRRERERTERRTREFAGEEEQSDEDDDDSAPITFAGGSLLEGMGLPTLDEAMEKLELRAKRQEEKYAAKKKREEEEVAKQQAAISKQEAEVIAKQKAETTKKETTNNGGIVNKNATTVNTTRDHEDMGEARRMPDCRCPRCDPCDCKDCHYAHYPTYRRKGLGV